MERGSSGGCRGGESDSGEGSRPPRAVLVRRRKEGCGLAGLDSHWGGRWAERPASPSTFPFFSIPFLFFCRKEKREKDKYFGVFIPEIIFY